MSTGLKLADPMVPVVVPRERRAVEYHDFSWSPTFAPIMSAGTAPVFGCPLDVQLGAVTIIDAGVAVGASGIVGSLDTSEFMHPRHVFQSSAFAALTNLTLGVIGLNEGAVSHQRIEMVVSDVDDAHLRNLNKAWNPWLFVLGHHGIDSNLDPFLELDAKEVEEARAEANRALQQLSGDLGMRVSGRLHQLLDLVAEETDSISKPSAASMRSLVDFLVQNRGFVKPSLTIDDDGLVWAEWRQSPNCSAVLHFLADGAIRWVIVSPAPMRKSGRVVWHGDGVAKDVQQALQARPALRWINRS